MRLIHDDAVFSSKESPPLPPSLHVVLTRFNMALPAIRSQGDLVGDEAFGRYLRERIPLFRSICLPSLRAQVQRPDHWLIGFDGATRSEIEPLLESLKLEDWIVPVWQETKDGTPESASEAFGRAIVFLLRPDDQWVVTSRVDNDDALGRTYCRAARAYAGAVVAARPDLDDFWLSFPFGVQFNGVRPLLYTRNNNAFLTRCEARSRFDAGKGGGCLQSNHAHVFQKGAVFLPITEGPMWLQAVHSSNILNSEKDHLIPLRNTRAVLKKFGIEKAEIESAESRWN
jgi:hypothetical protein